MRVGHLLLRSTRWSLLTPSLAWVASVGVVAAFEVLVTWLEYLLSTVGQRMQSRWVWMVPLTVLKTKAGN